MKDRLLEQARHEYSPRQRLAALAVEAVIFLVVLPTALAALGSALDHWLQWPAFAYGPANPLLGGLIMMAGWVFAIWSIYTQFTLGRGTPVPVMATQRLIDQPPYRYCRNPMALGAILMYLGVVVLVGSPGAAVLWVIGAVALLTYIKVLEEREMELRFGQDYLDYKARTAFLFPRRPKAR